MNYLKHTILFVFLAFAISLQAQTEASLKELLATLKEQIGKVETSKDTYEQSFSYEEAKPWKVKVTVTEVDKKGREEAHEYYFNLSDLDKHTIKINSNKNEQTVKLGIDNRQDFIRYVEDGEPQNYTDELEIWATDIDNARKLEEALEAVILPAKEAWEKAMHIPGSPDVLKAWLEKQVQDVTVDGDELLKQKLTFDSGINDRLRIDVEDVDDDETSAYDFSLADLNPRKTKIEVKGEDIFIEAETKKSRKFIEFYEEGELKSLENSLVIYVKEVDAGRQLISVLDSLIRYGESELEKRLPNPSNLDEGLKLLAAQISSFQDSERRLDQELKAASVTHYKVKETELDDGEEELNEYFFAFGDLNAKDVEIDAGKNEIYVEVKTKGNNKYIQHMEDGEPENFTSSIEIYAESIENARMIEPLLEYVVTEAGNIPVEVEDWNWLKEAVKSSSTDEVSQQIQIQEGESSECKLNLTRVTIDDDEQEEEIFEFNVYDLNDKKIEIDISGDEVGLSLETVGGEDIIKYYEDGEPGFTDDFTIRFDNLELAKIAKVTMEKIAEGCKDKK